MRKYAWLAKPHKVFGNNVCKIMLHETGEGCYLFMYSSPDAVRCAADQCYDSLAELYEDWNDRIDEKGWIEMEDPLPYCQQDAFIPVRVKGRNVGKPEWGKFETLKDGEWIEYKPADQPVNRLSFYEPEYEDLWFRQMMLADEETMSYNHAWGGTIAWPEEEWSDWYDYWIINHEGKRFYRYLKDKDGQFMGEAAYHYDADLQHEMADVIIYSKHRGKGYGGEALEMLCLAAKENGVSVLYDDIAIDNPAIGLFLDHGFSEEYRTEEKIMLKREL